MKKFTVPFVAQVKTTIIRPILNTDVQMKVDESLVPFTHAVSWKKWGMQAINKNNTIVLLHGPPGTGKTTIANWLAKKVGRGIIPFGMGEVAGGDAGDCARGMKNLFKEARRLGCPTLHADECNELLIDRNKLSGDSMWMLESVNEFLVQMENYDGLVIISTNQRPMLDPALDRRLSASIKVDPPNQQTRMKLWEQKIPDEFPLQLNEKQLAEISQVEITGAGIENAILSEARHAIRMERVPKFGSLMDKARNMGPESVGN